MGALGADTEGILLEVGVFVLEPLGTRVGVENMSANGGPRALGGDVTPDKLCLPRNDGILDIEPGGEAMLTVRAGGVRVGDCVGVELGVSKPEVAMLLCLGGESEFSGFLEVESLVGVLGSGPGGDEVDELRDNAEME